MQDNVIMTIMWAIIGGIATALLIWLIKLFITHPKIILEEIFDGAKEPELLWWHIAVRNVKRVNCRWWITRDVTEALIRFEVTPNGESTEQYDGRWQSDSRQGKRSKTLRVGDPRSQIPIAIQMYYRGGIYNTSITDEEFLVNENFSPFQNKDYNIRVVIYSGDKTWFSRDFTLVNSVEGLEGFVFTEKQ